MCQYCATALIWHCVHLKSPGEFEGVRLGHFHNVEIIAMIMGNLLIMGIHALVVLVSYLVYCFRHFCSSSLQ